MLSMNIILANCTTIHSITSQIQFNQYNYIFYSINFQNQISGGHMESKIIFKTYKINGKLGAGSFGQIFQGENIKTKQLFAVKIQKRRPEKESRLYQQAKLYKLLAGTYGICNLYEYGTEKQYNFMVIDKLSYSLEELFEKCGRKFSQNTVFKIGEQLISRIQYFHRKGYVHRDIKSTNFMIGSATFSQVIYLIDFGLAKPFKDIYTGVHIKRKGGKSLVGTARYASIASHQGYQQCRRDDLESLGYLLIYFAKGSLPWQGIKNKIKLQKYAEIGARKKQLSIEELCENVAEQFVLYFKYVKSLQFNELPNYDYLRLLFSQKIKLKKENEEGALFDWEINKKSEKMEDEEESRKQKSLQKFT